MRQRVFVFALLIMTACVEPYPPPTTDANASFLVVDGFLNGTANSAMVKINHSVPLASSVPYPPEEGATVSVEGSNGSFMGLTEVDEGVYAAEDLAISETENYRLHIVTAGGRSYRSDYVVLKHAPPIDSLVWRPELGGAIEGTRFYVNSHDPSNSTQFYRYLFTETWEYRVTYYSFWKKVAGMPVFRDPITEQVSTCWNSTNSTEILTASTKRLSTDIVSMLPVNFIKKGSRLLSRRYSINVQQRAISQEEYDYWQLIRKTTENLGGLFDPLPSQVTGNVHNEADETEQVLGYFSGGFVTEQRIFISQSDLPARLQEVDSWDFTCELKDVPINDLEKVGGNVFVERYGIPPAGFTAASPNCADCTSLGGKNMPPTFWIP